MISINDIKNGMTIIVDNNIFLILEFLHVKPGKGPAFMRTKLKNLRTGATIDKTFNTNIKVEKASIDKNKMQYLYSTGDSFAFMNMETYEQIELTKEQVGDNKNFLIENLEVEIVFFNGELLGISLPEKITVKVIETSDAVKGNTANNATKDATIETGLLVKVPLFIEQEENIIISTKDNKYLSRA